MEAVTSLQMTDWNSKEVVTVALIEIFINIITIIDYLYKFSLLTTPAEKTFLSKEEHFG